MKSSLRSVSLIGIIVLLASAFGGIMPAKAATSVFINEIHYDNDGTDTGEAIEIAGPAGTDLSGWSLVLYNGNGGAVYNTNVLSGTIPDQQNGFGTLIFTYPVNGIQNGSPDGVALVNGSTVVQFLSYEGTLTAVDGPAAGMASEDIGVDEPGDTPVGDSLQLTGSGSGYGDFSWTSPQANTFGEVNTGQNFEEVVVESPPSVFSTTPAGAAVGVAIDANIEITFSEAVEVSGSWFEISCVSSGYHSATVSGEPIIFSLDPESDFVNDETCTVTIFAALVTDLDTEDPPDTMVANFVFSFDTVGDQPVAEDVIINELDADQVSTDAAEFIELYDYGVGNTDLSGLVLVLFNGSDDASYLAFDLDGYSTDADGYFVLCGDAANVANCDLDVSPNTNLIQNGADAAALLVGDAADFPNDTPVTTDGLLDAIVYDTSDSDDSGLLVLLNASQPQVNEYGGGDGTAHSNQRCPDGSGGARNTDTYAQFLPTPGAENACVLPPPDVIINEVDADQVSTDAAEFVELYDYGVGNTDLSGLVLVLFNGSDDASYLAFDLDGYSTNSDGYFVLCGDAANVANCDLDVSPNTNLIQNGADAVALYVGDAVDFPNDTPVTPEGLLDAIVYDTNDGDDAALLVLLNAEQSQVNEDGGGDKDNHSNQRCPNGEGGARNTDAYTQAEPTSGMTNNCVIEIPVTPIYDIQYTTDPSGDSPLKNQTDVTTEGIVTAVFSGGYFIEDSAGGPWNGLWVYDNSAPSIGDYLRLTGKVVEYYGLTELTYLTEYVVQSTGNSIPGPNVVASGDVSQEQWEGVLVKVAGVTVTGDDLGYGEWSVSDGSGDVVIDDKGSYDYQPSNGDSLVYVIGVLDFGYGSFKIQPRDDFDIKLSLCGNPATFIFTIQGDGFASPLDGTLVDVEGIVTGDFQDGKSGFTIQDELGDGDTATSDGIFIYSTLLDVNVGDHVRVTGYVDEYYYLTEITGVSDLEICSTGNDIAATPISLPVLDIGDLEAYEGMLVTFPQSLYISEYYNFGRYGEIVLSTSRQFQPTATFDPGSVDAAQMLAENLLNRMKLDDGRGSQNPDPALHPNGSIFDLTNLFRGGDILNNLTGVVDYNYGEYKIQPTTGADYVSANPRTAQPDNVGGGLKVASFNVLNYFTTLDDGTNDICGPDGTLECRGADTTEEFTRQRAKIIAALAAIDADVVGLIEIENNEFEAVADLVSGLNDAVGAGTYAYVDTGYIGTDAIKVAFIYKTGTVSLVGDYAILDSSVDSRFIDTKNRPALAQSFMDNATGGIFTAVVNHLKSKGSPCDDIGDPDLGDGAGNCNLTRTAAAEALVDWLWTDPTNSGDADFLIMGDLNAYDKEDPIDAILAGGYSDLVYEYVGENAYSYVFDGQLGYLDHALANDALGSEISGVTVWHINADEASLIDYDMSYKKDAQDLLYEPNAYRSSDHDPVVIGLNVCDEIAPTLEIELSTDTLWPANHKYMDVTATVTAADNFDLNPTVTLLSVTSSEADDENGDGDGSTVDDIVILDDYTFQLRAERSATNKDGRVYTITYEVTDACGNSTVASAEVTVPHNQEKNKDSSGEADSLDLPADTEAIVPEPTEEPSDKDKKDK